MLAPTDFQCKTCKVPLPDTTWKNCASCRRNRTDAHNRWKKSAELRSARGITFAGFQMGGMDLNSSTSSQAPGHLDHRQSNEPNQYGDPSGSSQLVNDQPQLTSAPTVPRPAKAKTIEYQWSDELIDALLALPPCSRYIGKFSIIADPAVNNSTRAHMFVDQLRARAVPISEDIRQFSLNTGSSNPYALVSSCTCQEACRGQIIISVDDDLSHPYGVPGQRIGVVVVHSSPPD